MLFIFGFRSHIKKIIPQLQTECPHCHTQNMSMSKVVNYFHVWFIPMFPVSNTKIIECGFCKNVRDQNSFTAEENQLLNDVSVRKASKSPLWTKFGLIVFLVVTGGLCALCSLAFILFPPSNNKITVTCITPNLQYGTYYSLKEGDKYSVIRLLGLDDKMVGYSIFSKSYTEKPTSKTIEGIEPFVGHIPQKIGAVENWIDGGMAPIKHKDLVEDDLAGYRQYLTDAQGISESKADELVKNKIEESKSVHEYKICKMMNQDSVLSK